MCLSTTLYKGMYTVGKIQNWKCSWATTYDMIYANVRNVLNLFERDCSG